MVIDPSRRDAGVAQPLLDLGDVGLVIQRVGRGRCPQRVGADLEAERLRVGPDGLVDGVGRDGLLRPLGPAMMDPPEERTPVYVLSIAHRRR